jgi:CelD/BcsL family acetyltransferase involved in cellulose biosynthesis
LLIYHREEEFMQIIKLAPHSDAQVWALHDAASDQSAPEIGAASEYVVALGTERATDPTFCILWQALVADSLSPQKIYQTPAFFKFMQDTRKPGERLELLTVSRHADGALVGVVPVRISKQELNFNVGPLKLRTCKIEMINLLGSIPAAPSGSAMANQLVSQLLALFPTAKAVLMQALPLESAYWQDLAEIGAGDVLSATLMGPWQECHTLPLPPTFECYLGKFSAKKRYNLNRQIRQLTEQVGPLELERIERPEQVPGMMSALAALLSEAEWKTVLSEKHFSALAAQGLLLCHVLRAGDQVLAAILATRSPDTLHVHNIFVEKKHLALSVGTSAVHLAIKDLTGLGCLRAMDFGYGTPNHEFRSSHVLKTRTQVLLFDNTKSISLLFFIHRHFVTASEGLISTVKWIRKQAQAMRKALPA